MESMQKKNDSKLKSCRDYVVQTKTACTIQLAFYWETDILKLNMDIGKPAK